MHSTSSHDGHKHHRSQTLPIIRSKNAFSNPKLLQMIDSSTASKYRNYLLPSAMVWDLDQGLYRPFSGLEALKVMRLESSIPLPSQFSFLLWGWTETVRGCTHITGAAGESWLKFLLLSSPMSSFLQNATLVKSAVRTPSLLWWDLRTRLLN